MKRISKSDGIASKIRLFTKGLWLLLWSLLNLTLGKVSTISKQLQNGECHKGLRPVQDHLGELEVGFSATPVVSF